MCGIVGYTSKTKVKKSILQLMSNEITHRGPDGFGEYISPDGIVGLAHRRLSIIDLSERGTQPMSNEDGTIWITYNGEIYNFQEIRKLLVDKNHVFKSNSDTEVIIHAYEEWGTDCLERFNGMFAFCLYDEKQNLLFLARDRFGIKPLHYAFLENKIFAFASEIKAITVHPSFKKEINWLAVGDYFKYRYIPSPHTIWKNIFKLEHGYYGIFDLNNYKFEKKKYYNLPLNLRNNEKSSIEEVRFYFDNAIKSHMLSDVEVGTFLSGGIDSSSISVIAHKYNQDIKSFSIGFEPAEYSELRFSKLVADYIGTKHITQTISDLPVDIMDKLAFFYDEPLADSSCLPTFMLAEMTSKYLKVTLSGDGGDEVFSGYNWYASYLNDYNSFCNNLIVRMKSFFLGTPNILPDFETYYNKLLLNRFNDDLFRAFFTTDVYPQVFNGKENLMEKYICSDCESVRAVQYVDMNTFMVDDILTKVDRASMAHSLEVRVPLLDHELVESVLRLPEKEFPQNSVGKPVLKKIMYGMLPQEIFSRNKQGFSAPLNKWNGFSDIYKSIANGCLVKDEIINENFIKDLNKLKYPNSEAIIWMIFVFENWYKKWFCS